MTGVHMSFKRLAFPLFALAVTGTLVGLIQPAHVAERWSSATLRAPIPDRAPLPCKMQSWYNADRVCLSWTAPR
jgi:hypothetical protein